MNPRPILIIASSARRAREVAREDDGSDPPVTLRTWEQVEARLPGRPSYAALVCEEGEALRERRGLLEILRRAYADLPVISFSKKSSSEPFGPPTDPLFDCHITSPMTAANLRVLVAREERSKRLAREHRQSLALVREQSEKLELLVETAKAANSLLDPRLVMQFVMGRLQQLIRAESWNLYLLNEVAGKQGYEVVNGDRSGQIVTSRTEGALPGIAGWAVENHRPAIVSDATTDARCVRAESGSGEDAPHSIICVPLNSRGRDIGAVVLSSPGDEGEGRFGERDLELVRLLMEPAAITIENALLFKRLEELSITDDLTSLYNSRYLSGCLGREIKRAQRYGHSVSVLFLDLDGFKEINDRYGHLSGSRTLVEVGGLLKAAVRESDIVARYGGDEFTIVMPQTDVDHATLLAERLRQVLEGHVFLTEEGLGVQLTASFGVSTYPQHGRSPEDLISQADRAMYRVKLSNKNGVETAENAEVATTADCQ